MKKIINPNLLPVISVPHFLLGCFLSAFLWKQYGFPEKAGNTVKWGILGTIFIIIIALYMPVETLKLMWPVGIGINIGVGMALKTLQLPAYQEYLNK